VRALQLRALRRAAQGREVRQVTPTAYRLLRAARREHANTLRLLPRHQVHLGKNGTVAIVPGDLHRARAMRERR
jgi:hypothetical protein